MAEYIERRIAVEAVTSIDTTKASDDKDDIVEKAMAAIDCIPAADVAPVVRGKWVMRGGKRYCSVCKEKACVTRDSEDFWYTVGTKFCPSCGAKMEG